VNVIVSYPRRARSKEFLERRFFTVPLLFSTTAKRQKDVSARNVIIAFSDEDAIFADTVSKNLCDMYNVDCTTRVEPIDDLKHYSATTHTPMIVWLKPEFEHAKSGEQSVYYFEAR
jgi:hypothetical protein